MTSAAFLAAGILKSNLAFAYWGGAFLLLLSLCAAGVTLEAFRAARRLSSDELGFGFSAALPGQGFWFSGDQAVMRRASALRRPFAPWIAVELVRRYRRSRGPGAFVAAAPAWDGGSLPCGAPPRGRWVSESFSLRVRDVMGLVRWERSLGERDEFVVAPEPVGFGFRPPSGGGGPAEPNPESFRRSDELLDSRKYHPGDDARRINWKQYGHSGELFLRIGEREPPPKARYLVVVDPGLPGGMPRAAASAYAEALIALAAGCVLELAGRGSRVSIAAPGLSRSAEDDEDASGSLARLLAFLAEVPADDGSAPIEPPRPEPGRGARDARGTICYCPPDSPRASAFLASVSGARPMVVVPLMKAASAREYLSSLFKRGARGPAASPREARAFNARASLYVQGLRRTSNADARLA